MFKLDLSGRETVLYAFSGLADGGGPFATSLVRDPNGNLYGIAQSGGDSGCGFNGSCGVLFKISACHTATCRGGDDTDTPTAATNPATSTDDPSTLVPADPANRDLPTLNQLRSRRLPGSHSLGLAIGQMN